MMYAQEVFKHFLFTPLQKLHTPGSPPQEPLKGLFLNIAPMESPKIERLKKQIVKIVSIF